MDGKCLNLIRVIGWMLLCLPSKPAKAETCLLMPERSDAPTVKICETDDHYIFQIAEQSRTFLKGEFQEQVKNALADWSREHDSPSHLSGPLRVELWMSMPEVNPAAAQPRVVVHSGASSMSFWIDLWADHWVFRDNESAILGKAGYPDTFGYRPCAVLIQSQKGAQPEQVASALFQSGATKIQNMGDGWYRAQARAFSEPDVATTARNRYVDVIKTAQVNSVMEWIANRRAAFSFTMELNRETTQRD